MNNMDLLVFIYQQVAIGIAGMVEIVTMEAR
jgi:hypothetical protein